MCPIGWHVPTDEEWTELEEYLIANGYNYDGLTSGNRIAKSLASTSGWSSSSSKGDIGNDKSSNNSTGFTALPGGFRSSSVGSFYDEGYHGDWWSNSEYSSSNAWLRSLYYANEFLNRYNYNKRYGFSIRCLKD